MSDDQYLSPPKITKPLEEEQVQALLDSLEYIDDEERDSQIQILVTQAPALCLKLLRKQCKDWGWLMRQQGAILLGRLATQSAVDGVEDLTSWRQSCLPLLEKWARDDDCDVCEAAYEAIAEAFPEAFPALIPRGLANDAVQVQQVTLTQIGVLRLCDWKDAVHKYLRGDDSELRSTAIEAFCAIEDSPARLEPALQAATSDDWQDRCAAARAIGKYGTPEHREILETLLEDDDIDVQAAAIEALLTLFPDEAIERAQGFLSQAPYDAIVTVAFGYLREAMPTDALAAWIASKQLGFVGHGIRFVFGWLGKHHPALVPGVLARIPQVMDVSARLAMVQWARSLDGFSDEQKRFMESCCDDPSGEIQAESLRFLWPSYDSSTRLTRLQAALQHSARALHEVALTFLSDDEALLAAGDFVPLLEPLLQPDLAGTLRVSALRLLLAQRPQEVTQYLTPFCDDDDSTLRLSAMELLEKYGDRSHLALVKARLVDHNSDVRRAAILAASKLDPDQLHELFKPMCENDSWDVRRDAMHLIRERCDETAFPLLLDRLRDDDCDVRQAALEAAITIAPHQIDQIAAIMVADESWTLRRDLALALEEHGSSASLPWIEKLLEDHDSDVKRAAFSAMLQHAPPTKQLQMAIKACAQGEYEIGEKATTILREWPDPDAVNKAIAADLTSLVGAHAHALLELIQSHELNAAISPDASMIPALLKEIPAVKDHEARTSLAAFAKDFLWEGRIPLLRTLWQDPYGGVRCEAYLGLREQLPDEAHALSVRALDDDWDHLVCHALTFFGDRDDHSLRPQIEAHLESCDSAVASKALDVLAAMFPAERRALALRLLGHTSWMVRQKTAELLKDVGLPEDLPELAPLLSDDDVDVRRAAFATALQLAPEAERLALAVDRYGDYDEDTHERASLIVDTYADRALLMDVIIARIPQLNSEHMDACRLFELLAEQAPARLVEVLPHLGKVSDTDSQQELIERCLESGVELPIDLLREIMEESESSELRKTVYQRLCEQLPGERLLLTSKLLQDNDWSLRQMALEALVNEEDPDPAVLTEILPMARDQDYDVRMAAIRAIATFNDLRAYSEIVAALDDETEAVRELAKEYLSGGPEMMPILKRFAHLEGGEPLWLQIKRKVAAVHTWVQEIGFELLGRGILITQPGHKNLDDESESARKGLVEILLPDTPIAQHDPQGEEVMKAMALCKLGHYLHNEGTRGYKTMRGIANSEGLLEIYDLLAFERIERNLRSRRDEWGPLLDRLTSYAFAKTIYRVPLEQYAALVEASPEDTLAQISSGHLPGQLLPSKIPGQTIISLRDRDMLQIPNALSPLLAFVWCLRCGYEARLHPNPIVAEALALVPGNLKSLPHARILPLAREIAALLGSSDAHKQQFQDMMDRLMGKEGEPNEGQPSQQGPPGEGSGCQGGGAGGAGGAGEPRRAGRPSQGRLSALRSMMQPHLQRLGQTGGTPSWMSLSEAPQTGKHSGRVRKHRQVIYRRQQAGCKAPGGQAINLGKELDFDLLSKEEALGYQAHTHAQIVGPIRKHIRRLRSFFERLGRSTIDEYASRRGSRLDVPQARRLLYTTTPNLLVHSYEEIQADLYLGILIDRSGSMDGEKLRVAKSFGALVAESARSIRGIEGHVNAFDDDTFYYMGDFQRSGIAQLEAGGGNNDAAGLHRAAQLALHSRKKNRLLVMISDGSPTECSVDALRGFVQRLDREFDIRCAQVAVESLSEITFPHYVDLSQYPFDEAVSRFGQLLIKLTAAWR